SARRRLDFHSRCGSVRSPPFSPRGRTRPLTTAKYRWLVLAASPAAGLLLGLGDPLLGRLVQQLGMKPGVATAMSVNVLLPLVAIALGVACPRLVSVWAGAVCMAVGPGPGLAVPYHRGAWFLPAMPPLLVA